jgi:hypothetical protein
MNRQSHGYSAGLSICLVALIAGCATASFDEMKRPNTSPVQTEKDKNECWESAMKRFPKDVRNIMAGRIHTSCTTYKNNTTCTSEPYEPNYQDVNGKDRYDSAVTCLRQKGYK